MAGLRKSDKAVAERVAVILKTAAEETDYRRTWARVNRAAGMVAAHVALGEMEPAAAGRHAQMIADAASADITGPVKEGFAYRVGLALFEWYTGTCPEKGE